MQDFAGKVAVVTGGARGMTPAAVAEPVVDAVRADRFWILTHDSEAETWVDAVNHRAQSLIDRTDPALGVPL
jgi:NAD(P)-dependent dehydrogenase (short-subunit alcohol dehydrogenase family)